MKKPYSVYGGFYIQLPDLEFDNLPEKIEIYGEKLVKKTEFHISLVWVNRLAELIDRNNMENIEAEIFEAFENFIKENSLSEFKITEQLRFVEKESLKTLITMVKVENIERFFNTLSNKYKINLPIQPTHITLYTLPEQPGIGIFSEEELKEYSKPVKVPELNGLL